MPDALSRNIGNILADRFKSIDEPSSAPDAGASAGRLLADQLEELNNNPIKKDDSADSYVHYNRGLAGDLLSRSVRGAIDAAKGIAAGAAMLDADPNKDETLIPSAGKQFLDWAGEAEKKYDILKPDIDEASQKEGILKRGVLGAIESTPASLIPLAGAKVGAVIGAPLAPLTGGLSVPVGAAAGGLVTLFGTFGLGQYKNTYDETKKLLAAKGVPEADIENIAHKHALVSATAEAGGELAGDAAAMLFFGFMGKKAVKQAVSKTIKEILSPGGLKEFAKAAAKTAPFETGSEMATAYAQASSAQEAGISDMSPKQAVGEAVLPSVFMSLIFGFSIHGLQTMDARRLYDELNSTDPQKRVQAALAVASRMDKKDTQSRKVWMDTAGQFIAAGKEIPLSKPIIDYASQAAVQDAPPVTDTPTPGVVNRIKDTVYRTMGMKPPAAKPSTEQGMTSSIEASKNIAMEGQRQAPPDRGAAKSVFDEVLNTELNNQNALDAAIQADAAAREEQTRRLAEADKQRMEAAVAEAQAHGQSLKALLAGEDARKQAIVDDVLNLTERRLLTAVQKETGLTVTPAGPGLYSLQAADGPQPLDLYQMRKILSQKRIAQLDAQDAKEAADAQARQEMELRLKEKEEQKRAAEILRNARTALKPTPRQIEILQANRDKLTPQEQAWLDKITAEAPPAAIHETGISQSPATGDEIKENPHYKPLRGLEEPAADDDILISLMLSDLENSGSAGTIRMEDGTTTRLNAGIPWLTSANQTGHSISRKDAAAVLAKAQKRAPLTGRQQEIYDALLSAYREGSGNQMLKKIHWAEQGFVPVPGRTLNVDELTVGDRFVIADEEFTVTDIDDAGNVEMKDGTIRKVKAGSEIHDVDYVKYEREAVSFNPDELAPPAQPERRKDTAYRKKVSEMTEEEKTAALYTDEQTGLLNRRAYNEFPRKKYLAFIDGDSIGPINDTFGHAAGDELMDMWAKALRHAGIKETYRLHGDEFCMEADTAEALDSAMAKVYDYLENHPVVFTDNNGIQYQLTGGMSYGIGTDEKTADAALYESKTNRKRLGQRAEKGHLPAGLSRLTEPGRKRDDQRETLPETEAPTGAAETDAAEARLDRLADDVFSGKTDPEKFVFPADISPYQLNYLWGELYDYGEFIQSQSKPVIEALKKELTQLNKGRRTDQTKKRINEINQEIQDIYARVNAAHVRAEDAFLNAQNVLAQTIRDKAEAEGIPYETESIEDIISEMAEGRTHDHPKGMETWTQPIIPQVLDILKAEAKETETLKALRESVLSKEPPKTADEINQRREEIKQRYGDVDNTKNRQEWTNARDFEMAALAGYTEPTRTLSGWDYYDPEIEEINFSPEKKGHVSQNSIKLGKHPNGMYSYGIDVSVENSGMGHSPDGVNDEVFENKKAALTAAITKMRNEIAKRANESTNAKTYANKLYKELDDLAAKNGITVEKKFSNAVAVTTGLQPKEKPLITPPLEKAGQTTTAKTKFNRKGFIDTLTDEILRTQKLRQQAIKAGKTSNAHVNPDKIAAQFKIDRDKVDSIAGYAVMSTLDNYDRATLRNTVTELTNKYLPETAELGNAQTIQKTSAEIATENQIKSYDGPRGTKTRIIRHGGQVTPKEAEQVATAVKKAIESASLSQKSTAELVKDIFDIINDHIGERGSISTKPIDETLYQKLKPYLDEIYQRAKARALDAKAYLFGAVDSMPEGKAKDVYEKAATKYIEEDHHEESPDAASLRESEKAAKEHFENEIIEEAAQETGVTEDIAREEFEDMDFPATPPQVVTMTNIDLFNTLQQNEFKKTERKNTQKPAPKNKYPVFIDENGKEYICYGYACDIRSGWEWYAFSRPQGDIVYEGFVHGFEDEWGSFSLAELRENRIPFYSRPADLDDIAPPVGWTKKQALDTAKNEDYNKIKGTKEAPDDVAPDRRKTRQTAPEDDQAGASRQGTLDLQTPSSDRGTGTVSEESRPADDGQLSEQLPRTQPDAGQSNAADVSGQSTTPDASQKPRVGRNVRNVSRFQRPRTGTDHVIEPAAIERKGSWKSTAKNNLDIIELAKKIEAEGRQATPEEQKLLAQYTGFGASEIANHLFPGYARYGDIREYLEPDPAWKALVQRLTTVLTPEEVATAARSTQYAHYTSPAVIQSIYKALERFGFTGGKVLEPGMGTGHFFGLMPATMRNASVYTGIEMDEITARIAKQLYPNQNIIKGDYTQSKLPNDFFDLAIGNPPFASTNILSDPDYKKLRLALHDYFFVKSMDKVRPGGLLVFITSRYTMDKQNNKTRKILEQHADLLGAIRLPQTAFKQNAGTEVVTDVLFLRKKEPGVTSQGENWQALKEVQAGKSTFSINEYFADHPDMVLGKHSDTGKMYGGEKEYTVTPPAENIEEAFAAAVEKLPQNVYSVSGSDEGTVQQTAIERDFNPLNKKEGGLYVSDKHEVMITEVGSGVPLASLYPKLTTAEHRWLRDYISLRDALKQNQYDQLTDGPWEKSLTELQHKYENFVARHGHIRSFTVYERTYKDEDGAEQVVEYRRYKNEKLLRLDVESTLVEALEVITEDGKIVPGPFLKDRTIKKPEPPQIKTVPDALAVALNDLGRLDIGYIADLIHQPVEDVIAQLGDLIYEHPQKGWQLADEYLTGNVVEKLAEAKAAAAIDPRYQRNVEALIKNQPPPLTAKDITITPGVNWIPLRYYDDFMHDVLGMPQWTQIQYDAAINSWMIEGQSGHAGRSGVSEWATPERGTGELFSAVMNNNTIRVHKTVNLPAGGKQIVLDAAATAQANEVAKRMRARFKTWVWEDANRARDLLDIYNTTRNTIVARRFDGSHLTLPGVSLRFKLMPHQKNAIWRIIQDGNTYIAHAVGAGKTYEMVAAGMEQKRLGLIKKPMYVVPNHMLQQFANEFQDLYPMAHIMVADEENFHTLNRKRFVAQAALNNPDAIVITHSAFGLLKMKEENIRPVRDKILTELREALSEIDDKKANRVKIKQIERRIEQVEQRFNSMIAGPGDNVVAFEDLGVDFLFIDEAHQFRKLDFVTNRQAKGIDPNGSRRAMDLYIKTKWLDTQNPRRTHVFASGTPVTNTMGELYTVMKFFMEDEMEREGIHFFDTWASEYGEMSTVPEMNAAGRYELVERFSKFINLPELMSRVRTFMDVLTNTQLGGFVTRPKIKGDQPTIVITPASPALKRYQDEVLQPRIRRSKEWKPSPQQPGNPDPMINIITDGRLASIDLRLVDPTAPNDPTSKLNQWIDKMIELHKATEDYTYLDPKTGQEAAIKGAAQIAFYNHGLGKQVAQNRGFDARAWVMKRFHDAGIKASEVAWIDDYDTAAKKEAMFKAVRNGHKRILLGSAKKMGTGMNVQNRLANMTYLDAPWYPSDVEQPLGRIIRQGNQNKEVGVYYFATKGSYDATMWQMVTRKSHFIEDAFSGGQLRSMEDISETSLYEMAAALASGDERAVRLAGLNADINNLENLRSAHYQTQRSLALKKTQAEHNLEYFKKRIERLKEAQEKVPDITGSEIKGKVDKQLFSERKPFGDALIAKVMELVKQERAGVTQIGTIFDLPVFVNIMPRGQTTIQESGHFRTVDNGYINQVFVRITDHIAYDAGVEISENSDASGLVTRIINRIKGVTTDITQARTEQESQKEELTKINAKLGAPFEFAQELHEKIAEAAQITRELEQEGQATCQANHCAVNATPEEQKHPIWTGTAYRVDTGRLGKENETAADVIRYEREELGNTETNHLTDDEMAHLEQRPSSDLVWVTKTKEAAARYALEDLEQPVTQNELDQVEEYPIPPGSVVLAEDGDGGYLVLKGGFGQKSNEPMLSMEETGESTEPLPGFFSQLPNLEKGQPLFSIAQTLSPEFKKWFGNWEDAQKYRSVTNFKPIPVLSGALSRNDAERAYKNLKPVQNDYDQRQIRFVNHAFGKIARHKEKDLIFRLIPDLENIAKLSIPVYSEAERNPLKHNNIDQYHNYFAAVTIDGDVYSVRLTTQELKDSRNELHNVFVSDIEMSKAGSEDDISAISNAASNFLIPSFDHKLSEWIKKVKGIYQSTSKVVDATGAPLVVYHGTFGDFDTFKRKSLARDIGFHFGTAGQANEMTWKNTFAGLTQENGNIMPVYLKMVNPLYLNVDMGTWTWATLGRHLYEHSIISKREWNAIKTAGALNNVQGNVALRKLLQKKGYDGIIYPNFHELSGRIERRGKIQGDIPATQKEKDTAKRELEEINISQREKSYVVFEANQIKSAIGNRGTFDSRSNNIRYSDDTGKSFTQARLGETELKDLVKQLSALVKGITVIERDGQIWIKTKSGDEVQITAADMIDPQKVALTINKHYAQDKLSGKKIAGMYQPGEIKKVTLVQNVAGIWTLSHEFEHFLEDIGAISTADKQILDKKIAYLIKKDPATYGYLQGRSQAEKRAEWIGRTLTGMYDVQTPTGKILQKVRDIIDRIINALGVRTAYGVVRDIKTGKVFNGIDKTPEQSYNYNQEDEKHAKTTISDSRGKDASRSRTASPVSHFTPTVTGREEIGNVNAPSRIIQSARDAAQIAAQYLRKYPDEHVLSLVLDKKGKLIHIYRHAIGTRNQSQVSISTLAGDALNTPGAESIIVVHNHPSQKPSFSPEDKAFTRDLGNLLHGSGVTLLDSIVVTGEQYASYREAAGEQSGTIPNHQGRVIIPILGRVFESIRNGEKISGETDAIAAGRLHIPDGGMLLLDTDNRVSGTIDITDYKQIRGDKQKALLQELEKRNATAVIVYVPSRHIELAEAANIKKFINAASDIKLLDIIDARGSMLHDYDIDNVSGKNFLSLENENENRKSKIGNVLEDLTEKAANAASRKVSHAVSVLTGHLSPEQRANLSAFKKSWNEFWKPFSTVPDSDKILARRYESMGNVAKAVRFIQGIQEQIDVFPDDVKKDMFWYLNGDIPVECLPEEARPLAEAIKKRTEVIGQMLVDRGIISSETFEEHKGKYIHYMYAKHIVGEDAPVGITSSGKLDLSYTLARNRNLTMQQRKELGLIEDASVAVPVGMGKALTDIAKFDYLEKIADNPEWTWQPSIIRVPIGKPLAKPVYGRTRRYVTYGIGKLVEEVRKYDEMMRINPTPEVQYIHNELVKALDKAKEQTQTGNVPENYEQLPNSRSYGPLAGAYVLKPIAADLKPVMDAVNNDHGELFRTLLAIERQGMAAFKMGKVALNLPTACRNIVSNIIQINMSGRALNKIPGDIVSACESMKAKDKYYEEAFGMGLFNTNWFVTEINDVLQEFKKVESGRFDQILTAVKNVAKYYGKIDDISKFSIYKRLRESGVPIDQATLEAMKWGMDYSLTSRSIKGLRQTIAPFITYQYKIAPLIAESLKKRPWVLAKFALLYPLAKTLTMALHDLDDDDWEDLEKQLPAYIKKSGSMMILPWKTDKDQWQWINLEYFFPWGNMLAIFRDIKDVDSGELIRDLGISNPFLSMFFTGISARDDQPPMHAFFGTPIYNALDPAPVKAAKYLEYMANTWMPSMLTRQGALGYTGKWLTGSEDRWGREVSFAQALGRWFGLNILSVSPEQSRAQVAVRIQELRKEMSRIEADPSRSDEEKEEYRARLNAKIAELAEQAPSAVLPITKAKGSDPVYSALKDMAAQGILRSGPPSRTLEIAGTPITMPMDQYRDYLEQSSETARRKLLPLVTSPAWDTLTPQRKSEVVAGIISNARKAVRQKIKAQILRSRRLPIYNTHKEETDSET